MTEYIKSCIECCTVASTNSNVELLLGSVIDERWGKLCHRLVHSTALDRKEDRNCPCMSRYKNLILCLFWKAFHHCLFFFYFSFFLFFLGLFIHLENSYKLHPKASSGEAHVTSAKSRNTSSCHFMTVSSLKSACVNLPVHLMCVSLKCACTCMRMDRNMAMTDETWKRAEEGFQSISPVNNHPGCGLKARKLSQKTKARIHYLTCRVVFLSRATLTTKLWCANKNRWFCFLEFKRWNMETSNNLDARRNKNHVR